jgi:phage/plasmid-associated DNA primase
MGGFTRPKAVAEVTAKYELDNNPVSEFINEHGSIAGEPTADVYVTFQVWSQQAGHKNVYSRRKFTDEVIATTGLQTENRRHPRYAGQVVKCFCSGDALQK